MKTIKSILLFLFLFAFVALFGQDSTGVATTLNSNWFTQNWESIVALVIGIYELAVRLFPTTGNWSILTVVMNIIKTVIPNVKNEIETHD